MLTKANRKAFSNYSAILRTQDHREPRMVVVKVKREVVAPLVRLLPQPMIHTRHEHISRPT